jgi:hypothetical protein
MKAPRTKLPKSEAVRDARVVSGAALRCVEAQGCNESSPKHRTANSWGVKSTASK